MRTWWWKVRIHNVAGQYWHGQIATGDNLREIEEIKSFYFTLTSCRMVIEGMSEQEYEGVSLIGESFAGLWIDKTGGPTP